MYRSDRSNFRLGLYETALLRQFSPSEKRSGHLSLGPLHKLRNLAGRAKIEKGLNLSVQPLGDLVRPERFELPTPWFVAKYSIQLSYGRHTGANYNG